ncbi:MAG: hypothetical protein LH645_00960 [Actinomycetia bacterium]|nr:hypothetical protein [Actinomycetes bacterium]
MPAPSNSSAADAAGLIRRYRTAGQGSLDGLASSLPFNPPPSSREPWPTTPSKFSADSLRGGTDPRWFGC